MELNDYELVSLAKENNDEARKLIYQKYKPIIVKKSKDAFLFTSHHGIDINDIMQEGYIGLEEAIRGFSEKDGATFYTFAVLCIDRKIKNYIKSTLQNKNKFLNEAITIDERLENIISDSCNIEDSFMYKIKKEDLKSAIKKELTDFENKVFDLRLENYTTEEIAKKLNKDIKSIYNSFHRIKQKIKKILEKITY